MTSKILRWLVFGALASLLPLGFSYADLALRARPVGLGWVIGNGELLAIIWVLSAAAFGQLVGSGPAMKNLKILAGGFTLLIIVSAALLSASIVEARANNVTVDETLVVNASLGLYLISVVPCVVCVACSEA